VQEHIDVFLIRSPVYVNLFLTVNPGALRGSYRALFGSLIDFKSLNGLSGGLYTKTMGEREGI